VLEDAELLLGLWRHMSAFQVSQARSALGELEYAGKVYEIAWRLRGSGVSSAERVRAIGVEAKITRFELEKLILPALEQLGWVKLNPDAHGVLVSVDDVIPPPAELVPAAAKVLAIVMPSRVQLAALEILRATSRQPLERSAALETAADHGEQAAEEALRHLSGLRLVREVQAADGRSAVFNPNIWVDEADVAQAALHVEDAKVSAEVGALIEEVAAAPGMPEERVTSTSQKWVDFAVSQGLVQRSVVQTTEGDERRFLFTVHLARDAFGGTPGDASGHIRQMVGSMVYAATFARFKLFSPAIFLNRLIRDGEAGDASPIGTDYPMLETAGIVRVIPGSAADLYRLELLQSDVAEGALAILESREDGYGNSSASGSAGVRGQRSYTHIERERARLAYDAPANDTDTSRLLAALRQVTRGRLRGS
jgi:hypothetical protein